MPGRTLFLDTNVFLYSAGADHPLKAPAVRWLDAAAEGDFRAVTSAEVLQEILHVLIRRGRRDEALELVRSALDLCSDVLPVDRRAVHKALELLETHSGLSPRDALHAATVRVHGLAEILSADDDFDDLDGIVWVELAAEAESPPARTVSDAESDGSSGSS